MYQKGNALFCDGRSDVVFKLGKNKAHSDVKKETYDVKYIYDENEKN